MAFVVLSQRWVVFADKPKQESFGRMSILKVDEVFHANAARGDCLAWSGLAVALDLPVRLALSLCAHTDSTRLLLGTYWSHLLQYLSFAPATSAIECQRKIDHVNPRLDS